MQSRSPDNIQGIDVSKYQGAIDWMAVGRSGIQFAYVKASEGVGYVDPQFRRNAVGAPAGGLKVGFYHYVRPETGNTPQEEAQSFLDAIDGLKYDLPLMIDVEGAANQIKAEEDQDVADVLTEWVHVMASIVNNYSDKGVIIYTGAAFARRYLGAKLAKFGLAVAHYGVDQPGANATWSDWFMFQYSDTGEVPGIAGNVDLDEIDSNAWKELFDVSEETDESQITEDAANKVIADLAALYEACADDEVKAAAHYAAVKLREAAGIEEE